MRFFEHQRSARQATTRLLLAFFVTVLLLALAVNGGLWLMWWLLSVGWKHSVYLPAYFVEVNTFVTLFFVLGGWWMESSNLAKGGAAIARRAGARELRPEREPAEQRLGNIVSEMAIAARMPVPAVLVLPRQWRINAFAAGLTPQDAAIAVTDGALDALNREELQGLVAHELSHIAEGDTRLNTRLCGMVFGLEMVFRFGQSMTHATGAGGQRTVLALAGVPVMAVGSLGWVAGRLLAAAVSRQREYLADARAVQWTRNPDGLGGVLLKIARQRAGWHAPYEEETEESGNGLMDFDTFERQQPMLAHMMLSEPVKRNWEQRLDAWLSTHPPLDDRIQRIFSLTTA